MLAYHLGHGDSSLRVARIRAADGKLLDGASSTEGKQITAAATGPAIGFDGTNYVVAYAKENFVRVTRLRRSDLTVLDPGTDPTNPGLNLGPPRQLLGVSSLSVASGAGQSLVTWTERGEVRGMRFSSTGTVLDAAPMSLCSNGSGITSVYADGQYFVSFNVLNEPSFPNGTRLTRVRASDGALLESNCGIAVLPGVNASLTANGSDVLVVARGGTAQRYDARRVSRSGGLVDASPVPLAFEPVTRDAIAGGVASNGTDYYLADGSGNGARLRSSDLTSMDGARGVQFATVASSQFSPKIVRGTTKFLALFVDNRTAPYGLYASRVEDDGRILDGDGTRLLDSVWGYDAAFDGANYMAVSIGSGSNLQAARLRESDGAIVDTTSIATNVEDVCIGYGAGQYLVVWRDTANVVWARRLRSSDGTFLDQAPLNFGTSADAGCAIAGGANSFYVVLAPSSGGVIGSSLRYSDGARSAWQSIGDAGNLHEARLTYGNGMFFVAFGMKSMRIRESDGALLDLNGGASSLDGIPYAATFDGSNFVVGARRSDRRPDGAGDRVIVGRIRATDGALLDGPQGVWMGEALTGYFLWPRGTLREGFAVAAGPNNVLLGAFSKVLPDYPYGSHRIRLRYLNFEGGAVPTAHIDGVPIDAGVDAEPDGVDADTSDADEPNTANADASTDAATEADTNTAVDDSSTPRSQDGATLSDAMARSPDGTRSDGSTPSDDSGCNVSSRGSSPLVSSLLLIATAIVSLARRRRS